MTEETAAADAAPKPTTFEELLATQGFLIYTNVGCSMMPLLRQRKDLIEIRSKPPGRCRKYDVVLYKRGPKYILHRILKVRPQGYVIAGDHNTFLEYDITDDHILGVMTRVIRNGRTITMDDRLYRFYVHLWCDFYPMRMLILKEKAFARRVLRALKRKLRSICDRFISKKE